MQAKLVQVENTAKNIKTLWFIPEKNLDYSAGQFIEMTLNHDNVDNRGQKRWFTLSSAPTEKLISITTKQSANRMSSFKTRLFNLKYGDSVKISEPMGDFVLPKNIKIPLVFVAGGIGITPMRSMVKWLIDTDEFRNIKLIYVVNNVNDIAFKNLFERYRLDPNFILTADKNSKQSTVNQILPMIEQNILGNYLKPLIYVSGPEPFTELLENKLKLTGIASEDLILDFFPGYK